MPFHARREARAAERCSGGLQRRKSTGRVARGGAAVPVLRWSSWSTLRTCPEDFPALSCSMKTEFRVCMSTSSTPADGDSKRQGGGRPHRGRGFGFVDLCCLGRTQLPERKQETPLGGLVQRICSRRRSRSAA